MPETSLELPRVIAVPSDRLWLDPPFIGRQLYTQVTPVETPGAGVYLAAGINMLRWAIGFVTGPVVPANGFVAPWGDVSANSGWQLDAGDALWFEVGKYGPLVMGEWYLSTGVAGELRVIEIIRQA